MPRTRALASLAAIATSLALLTSCAGLIPSTDPENDMTLDEAQTALESEFDEVIAVVGGDWETFDVALERNCDLPGGGSGVRNSAFRIAKGDFDRTEAFERVKALWTERGFELTERESEAGADSLLLFGTTKEGAEIQFSSADRALGLDGLTQCVPAG